MNNPWGAVLPRQMMNWPLKIGHGALNIDRRWSARLHPPKTSVLYWIALLIAHTGDSIVWIGIAVGWWHRGRKWTASIIAITVIVIASIVTLIKVIVRRRRPSGQRSIATMTLDQHSFPSGHAARTIGLAVVLSPIVPQSAPWSIGWAILIGIARIVVGVHYLSDVIAGWIMGFIMGIILRSFFQQKHNDPLRSEAGRFVFRSS